MSEPHAIERKRVPLTRFHNATGEYLDEAMRSPIILTRHGRKLQAIVDNAYLERLEAIARGNILRAMDIQVIATADMPSDLRARILASQPTPEEIANDTWND